MTYKSVKSYLDLVNYQWANRCRGARRSRSFELLESGYLLVQRFENNVIWSEHCLQLLPNLTFAYKCFWALSIGLNTCGIWRHEGDSILISIWVLIFHSINSFTRFILKLQINGFVERLIRMLHNFEFIDYWMKSICGMVAGFPAHWCCCRKPEQSKCWCTKSKKSKRNW